MSLEMTNEDFIEGVARGTERALSKPENLELIAEKTAEKIAQWFELLEPAAAAALLRKHADTLQRQRHRLGLDLSVAFGRESTFYFLSQIIERVRAKVLKGIRFEDGRVTEFPQNQPRKKAG